MMRRLRERSLRAQVLREWTAGGAHKRGCSGIMSGNSGASRQHYEQR